MASKTYKIGERAVYGIWKVSVSKTKVMLQGIDYMTKEVEETKVFEIPKVTYSTSDRDDVINQIFRYLQEKMHYGLAEDITKYIKTKLGVSEYD